MILLSFDIEEFDLPTESGQYISMEQQIAVSEEGTRKILDLLQRNDIKATFFCTAQFAVNAPDIVKEISERGHEIASHGYYHSSFDNKDLLTSKNKLEEISGQTIDGFRMARMMYVDEKEIAQAGYKYNSSINPTFIPGRYNNLAKPRTYFYSDNVLQIPSSVTPVLRFPLFWLSFHNLPYKIYRCLANTTIKHDNYMVVYFHPWEFVDLYALKEFKIGYIIKHNSGEKMINRLERFIKDMKHRGYSFATTRQFISLNNNR